MINSLFIIMYYPSFSYLSTSTFFKQLFLYEVGHCHPKIGKPCQLYSWFWGMYSFNLWVYLQQYGVRFVLPWTKHVLDHCTHPLFSSAYSASAVTIQQKRDSSTSAFRLMSSSRLSQLFLLLSCWWRGVAAGHLSLPKHLVLHLESGRHWEMSSVCQRAW